MRILSFRGSHREIGRAFGETCREQIAQFYELRVANAIAQALRYGGKIVTEAHVLEVARGCLPATRSHDPDAFEELIGIAEGAGMPVERVIALNGLTDIRDVLSWQFAPGEADQCTAFIVRGDATTDGHTLCGQTWDLATDNMPYVLGVHRKPDRGPETWSFTTVGCLSLIGINEHGIAVGTTNIRTTDARPGVTYLSVIHRALSRRTQREAVESVKSARRAGAHYYYVVGGDAGATAIECTAKKAVETEVMTGHHVHTNHCLIPAHQQIEGAEPSSSSRARLARLEHLLGANRGSIDLAAVQGFLGDREHGNDAICRDDTDGISTNGAIIMSPGTMRATACHGLPGAGAWVELVSNAADATAAADS